MNGNGQVTQQPFDDYHLYDLNRTVSLEDGETKQVQFLEAAGVSVNRSYLYDGAAIDRQPISNFGGRFIQDQNYGLSSSNTKVQVLQEIKNTEANNLGIPLPPAESASIAATSTARSSLSVKAPSPYARRGLGQGRQRQRLRC
ncbi:MAG: hypothetical protein WDM87_05410 [Terracidiphilus sp.]